MPSGRGEAEYIEKRSRFIGLVWPVETETEFHALLAETRAKYHDARHNCWCCILRGGEGQPPAERYADDGEPQGTAGQPMLEVFRRAGIENVLCVVTRYFGGILLGAGGLARAYAHTARLALDSAGTAEMKPMVTLELVCPYGLFERVKTDIAAFGGIMDGVEYAADITVQGNL